MSIVNATLAWPSASETTFGWTPDVSSDVANECRKSCNRTSSKPRREQSRPNACELDPELRHVALHEAGHASVAYELQVPTGLISARPLAHFSGVAFFAPSRVKASSLRWGSPVVQPAGVRRQIERRIMTVLGGEAAARLLGPIRNGYVSSRTPDSDEAARLASILTTMPPSRAELDRLAETEQADLPAVDWSQH